MPSYVRLGLTFMTLLITGARCLKNVKLELIPEAVERGNDVTLKCDYDLEGEILYSLKWYRGTFEFYRYSPNESPALQVFEISLITVDRNNSNESQVTIKNVDYPLGGIFTCEVTTDLPNFSTASSSKTLTVVSVPKGKPVIVSERGRYESGETLKANCSMPSSKPAAELSFTLNELQVLDGYTRSNPPLKPLTEQNRVLAEDKQQPGQRKKSSTLDDDRHRYQELQDQERQWLELTLVLQPFHFVQGQLALRCYGKIPGFYDNYSEVQLGSVVKEPIPERVTFENGSDKCRRIADLTTAGLILLHLLLR